VSEEVGRDIDRVRRIVQHEGDSMVNHSHEPCTAEDLEVRPLSDHEWRVGDRRQDERSPEKVLGYIQRCGSTFEVLNIEVPRHDLTFDRLESAVASFAA
jgi:hypothetical protein